MIVGLGMDLVDIKRLTKSYERHGQHFAAHILTPTELAAMPAGRPGEYLAARFAAKEAGAKALGTGFSGGVSFQDFEVAKDTLGKPLLTLRGRALEEATRLGTNRVHLSLTHSLENAGAVVILESDT